jgi:hypothetical protein
VELDDAYLGGKRSGGKSGRSSENKVPFVLAVQTTDDGRSHQVCAAQLPFRRSAVAEFRDARLLRPLTVVSGRLDCFTAAARSGLRPTIVAGGGKASVRWPEFASVDIVLANRKVAITGRYHAVDFAKHSCRFLAEYRFRSHRLCRMRELLPRLLRAVACATALSTALARAPAGAC